jgi:hypothetical protein
MANDIGWGQGAVDNGIGWGQGAINNDINWGDIYYSTDAGETDIIGSEAPPVPTYEYSLNNEFTTRIKPLQSGFTIANDFLLENLTEANERGLVYGGEEDNIYFNFEYLIGLTIADPVHPVNVYYQSASEFYYNQDEFPFIDNCPIENSNIVVDANGGFRAIKLLNISDYYSPYRINGDFLTLNYSQPTPYIVNTNLSYTVENNNDQKDIYVEGESYSDFPEADRGVKFGAGDDGMYIQFEYHYIVLKDDGEGGEFIEEGYSSTNLNLGGNYDYGNFEWGIAVADQGGNINDWYLFEIVDIQIINNNNQDINGGNYYLSTNPYNDIWTFEFNF